MRRFINVDRTAIAYLCGSAAGVWWAQPWFGVGLGALALWWCAAGKRGCLWLATAAVGITWGGLAAVAAEDRRLSACATGITTIVEGEVAGLPVTDGHSARFEVALDGPLHLARCGAVDPGRLRLVWFGAAPLLAGERWQFEVRLRALRNFDNPGGFDYLAWAQERGVGGAGSVRRGVRVARAGTTLDGVRDNIARVIAATSGEHAQGGHGALYRALSLGDARGLSDATWQLYRATGTVHLLVISGLHVAIAAALGAAVGAGFWRLLPWASRRASDHGAAALVGAVGAAVYAALAGFELPVMRALVMAVAGLTWWCAGRQLSPSRVLLLTLTALLAVDPVALFDTSLWLSFGAVAVLVAYFHTRRGIAWGTVFARAQGVLFVGLLPILVSGVGQIGWLAPLANAGAVPLVSLILVPLMLLALVLLSVSSAAAGACYAAADIVADRLADWLQLIATPQWQSFWPTPTTPALTIAVVASGIALLPLPRVARALVVVPLIVFVLLPRYPLPAWGQTRITVLDVGQGLAVLLDTARERLLVDAGPRYPSGFDLGASAVVPALRATGPAALDLMIVSHSDLDHAGGIGAVLRTTPTRAILAGESTAGATLCRRGASWQWSGVTFRVLGPKSASSGNSASCVIHVVARSGSAMLPGDIGAADEQALARSTHLVADFLVAPHHGSRTSSSMPFLVAVSPAVVAISSGAGNPFGHPHSKVLSRYAAIAARVGITAHDGALVWRSDRPFELVQHIP